MYFKSLLVSVASGCALLLLNFGMCRADVEDQLLKKFQNQNQSGADQLKQAVNENLTRASSPGKEDPGKLLDLLRKNLAQLHEDGYLPKEERTALIKKVQERVDDLKQTLAKTTKKEEKVIVRLQPGTGSLGLPDYQMNPGQPTIIGVGPGQPTFMPRSPFGIGPFSSFTVTPVVGPGASSVRIGISGSFSIPTIGPLVPVQIPVPSIFYGPGGKFTKGQPESIYTIFLPFSSKETISVDTTVTVPDGGTVVLGGSKDFAESRTEVGAPGLGKVPYVGRLFRNTASGRQVSSSRLSIGVRIISLEKEEQKLYGK